MAFKLPKLTNNTNYLKNATKSIAFIAADVAKAQLVPAVSDFVDNNKDFIKATYSNIRIPKMKDRRNISAFTNNKILQAVNYGLNNLKTDLASGDFYAKARADADIAEVMGFDMSDWDDLSDFDFDDDFSVGGGDTVPSAEVQMTKGDAAIIKSIEGTSSANARATVNAILGANEQSIKNSRITSGIMFQQQEKIFASTHRDLSLIGGTLTSLFDFTTNVLGNVDKNLSEYQSEMVKQTNTQTEILKDILEIQRNQYKSAQERELESSQKRSSKRKRIGDIYGLEDYFDMVKDNAKGFISDLGFGGDDGGLGIDGIIKMFGAAPVKEILTGVMGKLIPTTIKKASEALNDSISGIFGNIMARLDNGKDDFGFGSFLASIFGINNSVGSKVRTGNYEKGPVPFDGITRKAIIDVIPGYLSRIEAFLTGSKIKDFDFDNGRWQDLAKGREEFEKSKRSRVNSAMYDLKDSGFAEAVKSQAPAGAAERADWDQAVQDFYEFLYKNNGIFNAQNNKPEGNKIDPNSALGRNFEKLMNILDTYDEEEYIDSKGRKRTRYTKSSVKTKLATDVLEAKTAQQRAIDNMSSQGHTSVFKAFEYGDAIPEFAESFSDRLAKSLNNGNLSKESVDTLFEYRDKFGNTIHTYLYNINKELQYIRLYGGVGGGGARTIYGSNGIPIAASPETLAARFNNIDLSDRVYLEEQARIRREADAAAAQAAQEATAARQAQAQDKNAYKKEVFRKILEGDVVDLRSFSGDQEDYVFQLSKMIGKGKLKEAYEELYGSADGYNDKIMADFFKKQFTEAGITSKELYETAKRRANSEGKHTYEVIKDSERTLLNKILVKIGAAREGGFLDNITQAPARAFSNVLFSADRAIYEMFFKYNFKNRKTGEAYNGFLDFLAGETKNVLDKIKVQIFDPLKEKINNFIEGTIFKKENRQDFFNGLKESFTNGIKAIGRIIGAGTNEAIIQPVMNSTAAQQVRTQAQDIAARIFPGESQESQDTIARRATNMAERLSNPNYRRAWRMGNNLKRKLRERQATTQATDQTTTPEGEQTTEQQQETTVDNNALGSLGVPYTGRTMLTKGEVLLNARGASVVPKTGLYNVENSHIINTEDAHDYLGVKGPRTSIAQAKAAEEREERKIFGRHAEGTIDIKKLINSQGIFNKEYNKLSRDEASNIIKEAAGNAKAVGGIAGGGLLGALISGLFGLAGGPLVGAGIGAGVMMVKRSKILQNFLFGKVGEDGEREDNGLIKKSVQDVVKKYAPDVAKYAGAGFVASLFTPLGPIGGIMLGGAIGYLKNNDEMRERLFGKLKIGNKEKEAIKKMLPAGLKGAGVGAIATLFGGPFGLIGNAAVGGAIGMMTSTEEFKKLMIGERINGVLQGGILQPIKDAFAPIAEAGNEFKDRIFAAIDDNIVTPIQRFVQPTLNAIPRALGFLPRMIAQHLMDGKFGLGLSGIFRDFLVQPLTKALTPAVRLAGTAARVATTPFRLVGAVGNKIHKGQIDSRTDTYETAAERVAFNRDVLGRDSSAYDVNLANIGKEGGMSVERAKTISQAITLYTTSRETLSRQKKGVERQILRLINGWKGNNGQTLPRRVKAACIKAIDKGSPAKIADILRGAGLSNNEMESLWGELKPLIDNWTQLYTKEQEARNMSDADKTKMGKDLRAAFKTELGLEGINFNNMDQMSNIAKQLNLEVEDREGLANMKAPEIQISDNVSTITDIIVKWATKGIKLADENDTTYNDEINQAIEKHTNLGKADTSIAKALARGTKQADKIAGEGTEEAATDEMTRRSREGGIPIVGSLPIIRKLPFIGKRGFHFEHKSRVAAAAKKYHLPEEIVNVLANMGKFNETSIKSFKYIYDIVKFDAEGAGYIAATSIYKQDGLNKIFNNKHFKDYFNNRSNNKKFITSDEIRFLVADCHRREFRRVLFHKLKLVSDTKSYDKFQTINSVYNMSGDAIAELQGSAKFGADKTFNFFEDQETNRRVAEARAAEATGNAPQPEAQPTTAPDHHFLGSILGGLGDAAGSTLSGIGKGIGTAGDILGGIGKGILGIGGGLLKGALGIGGKILGGIGKGISSLFGGNKEDQNQQAMAQAGMFGTAQAPVSAVSGATEVGGEEVDKQGDKRTPVATEDGVMQLVTKPDNSVEPDTTDQTTKATLNAKAAREAREEKSRSIADRANEAIAKALEAGEKAKNATKKGMGWLTKLLLGGMLANAILKSGILGKVKDWVVDKAWPVVKKFALETALPWIGEKYTQIKTWVVDEVWPGVKGFFTEKIPKFIDGTVKPLWNDHIEPFITGTLIPKAGELVGKGITEAIPAIGSAVGNAFTTALQNLPSILRTGFSSLFSFLDKLIGHKEVSNVTTINGEKLEEKYGKDEVTGMIDENGNPLTVEQIKNKDFEIIKNSEGTIGEYDEATGNITFIDEREKTPAGLPYAKKAGNAFIHALGNPAATKLGLGAINGTQKIVSKITTRGPLGAITRGVTNVAAEGAKAPLVLANKAANSPLVKKLLDGFDNALKHLFNDSKVISKLKNTALVQKISDFGGWLSKLKDSITEVFRKFIPKAAAEGSDDAVAAAAEKSTGAILGKALTLALLVKDFITGYDQAEKFILTNNVTTVEAIVCGFVNALCEFLIVPAMFNWTPVIAQSIIKLVSDDLEERQAAALAEYEEWVEKNGSNKNKSLEQYLASKYSKTGWISEAISDLFKDDTVTTMENSPSLSVSFNKAWDFTGNMTDADVAKLYSEMTTKKLQTLENNVIYEARDGNGYNTEILKRIEYIKKNNPELLTSNPDTGYLWTGDMSKEDILQMYENYKMNDPMGLATMESDYKSFGGLGWNGEFLERYYNIINGGEDTLVGTAKALSAKEWPYTYKMSDEEVKKTYEAYPQYQKDAIAAGQVNDKKVLEIAKRYNEIKKNGSTVAHNADGTVSLSNLMQSRVPTDYELKNNTSSIMQEVSQDTEASVFNVLKKLAGGIFGSVRTTMKDYATAIRSAIGSFGDTDTAIRAVQDGNLSIFSEGYWDFGKNSTTMGAILNDLATGMGRTVAAPLLVVKSAMKSLVDDIHNIGPWMTSHFADLAGFFLHPMDYIYNEVLKNFIYAQSPNASGYVSPEGAVLSNIMNTGGRTIIKKTTTSSGGTTTTSTGSSSSTSSGSTSGTASSTTGGEESTGSSLLDKIRSGASSVASTIRSGVNTVASWLGLNKPDKTSGSTSSTTSGSNKPILQRIGDAVTGAASTVVSTGRRIGSAIGGAASSAVHTVGDALSNFGNWVGGLFGKGKYSKQNDPSIANIRFNARGDSEYQTIGDSACGPTAAVNVIESMFGKGKTTNPVVAASNFALSRGYKEQDGGTRPEFFSDYFNKFGLDSQITYSKKTVEDNINAGLPTVLMGSDARGTSSSHPFGENPHYVTVTGTDGRGHAIVQDPESQYSDQVYDVKDLVKRTSIGVSAYGRAKHAPGISKSRAKSIMSRIQKSYNSNGNMPTKHQVFAHSNVSAKGKYRYKFGRGRDVENQDLCVWADVTGEEIDNFLRGYCDPSSPFIGNGALIVEIGNITGMDPVYIMAHGGVESAWGSSQYARERGNYFGIGAYDNNPDNAFTMASSNGDFHPDGLLAGVQWIKENYYDNGQTSLYLFNHAADGWHNYRTSDFSPEVSIMNSCYDSISGYDNREKRKHTGNGQSTLATSANTNNSNSSSSSGGTTTTVKDTRNMLLIKGLHFKSDSDKDKLTIGSTTTSSTSSTTATTTPSITTTTTSSTTTPNPNMPSSYNSTIRTQTERGEAASQDSATDADAARQEQLALRNVTRARAGQEAAVHRTAATDADSLRQEQLMVRRTNKPTTTTTTTTTQPEEEKPGFFGRIINGIKHFFTGKGTLSDDYRTVTKFGRGDEEYSIGQWINKTLTDSPVAQVLNSFLDIGGPKQQEQAQATSNGSTIISSGSTTDGSSTVSQVLGSGKAADVVRVAQHEAELTDGSNMEQPNGSNSVKYNDWYYGQHVSGDAYPWCAAFVSWVLNQAGVGENILPKTASAPQFYENVGSHGGKYVSASEGAPGDIITFSNSGDPGGIYHVGLVENVSNGRVNTIEGNTYQGSGDWGVYRVNYDTSDHRLLLGRPNYGTGTKKKTKPKSKYGRAKDFFKNKPRRFRVPKFGRGNRASEVWNWFRTNGYSEQATAGILGNMEQESTVDPTLIQGDGAGPAAGIVQWEDYNNQSGRWLNMANYAKSKGRDWTDLESQLEFIDKENKEGSDVFWSMADVYKSYDAFKNADNVISATDSFEQAFERAGIPMMENRYTAANNYFTQFTGKEGDKIGSSTSSGSSGGSSSGGVANQEYSIGQWLNKVLTDSPVAQVLNSFLDIGGGSTSTTEEVVDNGGDAANGSSEGSGYTGNGSINSTPGSGGNSPLATVTILTGNNGGQRGHQIDTITIHYMAGDLTAESCGNWFANPDAQASSNYGVDSNGVIGLYVEECNRAWTSANTENDDRAITIEVANQPDGSPTQAAYNALIELCADICVRNGIPKLLWQNDPSLVGQIDKQNMTLHKWVSTMEGGTDCPGPWFSAHMGQIANDVNAKLGAGSGRGKYGRGNGIRINKSKLGVINHGLGKDGIGRFGRGKTKKSTTPLFIPSNINKQITNNTTPSTKRQRFAKALTELSGGKDLNEKYYLAKKKTSKYGKGSMPPTEAAARTIQAVRMNKKHPVGEYVYGTGIANLVREYRTPNSYATKKVNNTANNPTYGSTVRKYTGIVNNISSATKPAEYISPNGDMLIEDNILPSINWTIDDAANTATRPMYRALDLNDNPTYTTAGTIYGTPIHTTTPVASSRIRSERTAYASRPQASTQAENANYVGLIKEIIRVLLTVAQNTDKLNTIITILQNKLGIEVKPKDVADAQGSANSSAYLANTLMKATNKSTNLNAYADTVGNSSIESIIMAMNAIAAE